MLLISSDFCVKDKVYFYYILQLLIPYGKVIMVAVLNNTEVEDAQGHTLVFELKEFRTASLIWPIILFIKESYP